MKVNGKQFRTVWVNPEAPDTVKIIDQRKLPFSFEIEDLSSVAEVADAIRDMHVRGAGCIGATAGFGMALAARAAGSNSEDWDLSANLLLETRPTAVNLRWAVRRVRNACAGLTGTERSTRALEEAQSIANEDVQACGRIGKHGLALIKDIAKNTGGRVNVLTHCNAGWLAFVDHGSATSPIYAAHDAGIDIHVWVDETRPRNQGTRLTAWELAGHGVPHTVVCDNAGGHLIQRGKVDLVITGSDRTSRTGDVANKIGTYLKALAARDNDVPFYVALPTSTIDWECDDGQKIPIEQRDGKEVRWIEGMTTNGDVTEVSLVDPQSAVANHAFDVTPARLVSALITERGIFPPDKISALQPASMGYD